MATVTIAPWQQTMQSTRAYTQLCFAVGDFSYFSGRQALQEKAPVIYRTQFHQLVAGGAIPEGQFFPQAMSLKAGFQDTSKQQEIKDLAQKAGEDVKNKTREFAKELEGEVKNKPASGSSVSDWKEKLKRKNEEKKQEINKMMDDSMNNAMGKIEELPEEQRAPAADGWSAWWDFIMNAIAKVIQFLDKAWQAICDVWANIVRFVDGVVKSVKEWAADAERAISGALSKIGDVFSGIFK
ncbi:hypothetical protein DSL72_002301 [Monilinia vaccinii-corymbosi]|uniref:Uncharacterized protein n=1 Tax=Monilinia vaccinii-corymbosi TaxID=61207 RepID=A0A8A3PC68_9HELO|nr:hypothetical protein DSL72_002301 [Monilinia vaccinii-corymbosi]